MRLCHTTLPRNGTTRPAYTLAGNHSNCSQCVVWEKHPKDGVTGLHWVQGTGYFGGEGLLSAGGDGMPR